jgi:hypothetical protein
MVNRKVKLDRFALKTKLLNASIGKDETRRYLSGVYHCPETRALVSCDGHRLTVLRSRYSDALSGKILDLEDGTIIDREYPRIKPLIPDFSKLSRFEITIQKHQAPTTKVSPAINVYFYLDATVSLDKRDDALFSINARYLSPLADGHARTVYYNPENKTAPVVFLLDTDDVTHDFYLVMPLKF